MTHSRYFGINDMSFIANAKLLDFNYVNEQRRNVLIYFFALTFVLWYNQRQLIFINILNSVCKETKTKYTFLAKFIQRQ